MSEENKSEEYSQCSTCDKKKEACVSFLSHENAMMHKDMDNERSHKTIIFCCATFIVITLIFVFAYTVRMNSFIALIKEMNADIVKLANAKGSFSP